MSEQAQQWEIVNGVWKETTPKTIIRTDFMPHSTNPWTASVPEKAEREPTIYTYPSSLDQELDFLTLTFECCSFVFSRGPQDLDRWFDRLSGERSEDVYRRLQEWLGENAYQKMLFGDGPHCPSGEPYQKYGLAIRVSQESYQDHGDKLVDVVHLFFAMCAEKTIMSLVRRECVEGKMLYWRKPFIFHRWDNPEYMSTNMAISTRLAFGHPVPERVW